MNYRLVSFNTAFLMFNTFPREEFPMTGKERLIELLKLLYTQTDEDHPMSTPEIVSYFIARGIPTDRETIKADVDTLNNCGLEIYAAKTDKTRDHFSDRQFELAELKLLVDAVESSKFITAKKSDRRRWL